MTDDRLTEIGARWVKTTPGPWDYDGMHNEIHAPNGISWWVVDSDTGMTGDGGTDEFGHSYNHDFRFMAAAHDDIPWLIARVRELEASVLCELSLAAEAVGRVTALEAELAALLKLEALHRSVERKRIAALEAQAERNATVAEAAEEVIWGWLAADREVGVVLSGRFVGLSHALTERSDAVIAALAAHDAGKGE